jgi:excisionase family DNA binding protein
MVSIVSDSGAIGAWRLQMTKAKQGLSEHEPLTVSIRTAATMLGIGRSTLYELLGADEIETIRVGGRRLVMVASLKAFVEAKRRSAGSSG